MNEKGRHLRFWHSISLSHEQRMTSLFFDNKSIRESSAKHGQKLIAALKTPILCTYRSSRGSKGGSAGDDGGKDSELHGQALETLKMKTYKRRRRQTSTARKIARKILPSRNPLRCMLSKNQLIASFLKNTERWMVKDLVQEKLWDVQCLITWIEGQSTYKALAPVGTKCHDRDPTI